MFFRIGKGEEDMQLKNKRILVSVSGVALIFLVLNLYDRFVLMNIQQRDFVISPVRVFCGYVGRPVFWMLVGMLAVLLLSVYFPFAGPGNSFSKFSLWCGIVWMIFYAAMVIWQLISAGSIPVPAVSRIMQWLLKNSPVFLIPGVLMGLGFCNIRGICRAA